MDINDFAGVGNISVVDLVINLATGAVLAFGLALYYMRFGKTLSNREQLARVIPILALTTLLVITVVKSSLALSLGLVGALSIVRFRTPIKEPEELAYLFLAIGLGVGLGADQRIGTIVAVPAILAIMLIPNLMSRSWGRRNTFIRAELENTTNATETFTNIVEELSKHVLEADIRRMDLNGQTLDVTLYVSAKKDSNIVELLDGIRQKYSTASITFVEQDPSL